MINSILERERRAILAIANGLRKSYRSSVAREVLQDYYNDLSAAVRARNNPEPKTKKSEDVDPRQMSITFFDIDNDTRGEGLICSRTE
jgi:hypothetical protein